MRHSWRVKKRSSLGGTCIGIYPGQYYDAESGLHYNYHRYYDPKLGRYLRPDPLFNNPIYYLFAALMNPNSQYDYVKNNPIKLYDPVGLYPQIQGAGAGWEAHFIYGYGRDTFYCCDGCNLWRIRTSKHCLGAGFLVSGGGTAQFTGSDKSNTCPDGYGGFAAEFGVGPGEYGLGISESGLTNSLGVGGGAGGKATVCYYRVLEKTKIGKCSL